jgi:hypothetical protein
VLVPRITPLPVFRKRRPAVDMAPRKTSLDVKARALVPPNLDRLYEIIEEIADHLRPWKGRKNRAAIISAVDTDLTFLLMLSPHEAKRGDRKKNRDHARQLDQALLKVEILLASAPDPLKSFLLNPLPTMTKEGVWYETPSNEDIERANRKRADSFAAELKRLRKECARAINPGFGYDPNYDRVKHFLRWFRSRAGTGTVNQTHRWHNGWSIQGYYQLAL